MSEPHIIGLTGYARSGKDSVGRILVEHHGFRRVAFGDVLKAVAEDVDPVIEVNTACDDTEPYHAKVSQILELCEGWERAKDEVPEARQFLVDLGNSLRRRIPGVEVAAAFADVKPGDLVVNTNVYHPEEIEEIRSMGGLVLRVIRPGYGPANPDERATGNHPVDGVIYNDGSLDKLAVSVDLHLRYHNVPSRSRHEG